MITRSIKHVKYEGETMVNDNDDMAHRVYEKGYAFRAGMLEATLGYLIKMIEDDPKYADHPMTNAARKNLLACKEADLLIDRDLKKDYKLS